MRRKFWGKHGYIVPEIVTKAVVLVLEGIVAVLSVASPILVWAFM